MAEIAPNTIDRIFMALDRQIDIQDGNHIGLVVCGGTALAALGLVSRATKDVSEGFKLILKDFLRSHGYGTIAERI